MSNNCTTELKTLGFPSKQLDSAEPCSDEDYDCDDYYYDNDNADFEDDDSMNVNDIYQNDPEHFEFTCHSLENIDWIVEKKCERLIDLMNLQDPLDALFLLKMFKWNVQKITELYEKDKQAIMQIFSSDKNNNSNVKGIVNSDRVMLMTYVNIFNNDSRLFANIKLPEEKRCIEKFDTFCEICWSNQLNCEQNMAAAIDECGHFFCRECWRAHFESLINDSFMNRFAATSTAFQCMQTKCKAIASKDFVLKCLKYNINNNEESYCAGSNNTIEIHERFYDEKTSSICGKTPQASASTRKLAERYKQLVAMDLIKESEDIQVCPGEIIIQERKYSCSNPTDSPSFNSFLLNKFNTPQQTKSVSKIMNKATPEKCFVSALHPKTSSQLIKSSEIKIKSKCTAESQKCNSIVWIKSDLAAKRVTCTTCDSKYCFLCAMPYHAPNSCQVIKKWLAKCEDDSETRNYLLVYTQDCPKCRVRIEKNGGCSHMTCNRCKHEFCWVCSNDWKSHGVSYDCNRYKGNPEQDEAREALNRYTHYYHRWINHSNSLKFEKAFKEQCELKIQEKILNKEGGTLVDWEFLKVAVEHLTRARYTLQYTYPYAYYLEADEGKKMLFENIQAELERDVENLSHNLEKVTLNDKFNIESQMNIVEKRRRTLLLDFNN